LDGGPVAEELAFDDNTDTLEAIAVLFGEFPPGLGLQIVGLVGSNVELHPVDALKLTDRTFLFPHLASSMTKSDGYLAR
jgi:hypothetical protein